MRIAFVTETWRPEVDGVVTRLDATVSGLVERGHEILVIGPTMGPPMTGVEQWQTRRAVIPLIDRRRAWAMPDPRIPRRLRQFDPDLVHVVSPVLMGALALRQLAGRYPVVASFHTDLAAYALRYGLAPLVPVLHALTRANYRRADLRLATSSTGQRRLADCGVHDAVLWPPGIDAAAFTADLAATGETPVVDGAVTGARPIEVICVGRLAREKGCDRLWGPMNDPAASRTTRLTFVGDGPDRSRLEQRFGSTPTSFAGVRRGAALVQTYRRADVLACPSVTETVGLVLMEAMALGLPVVAVDTDATRATLGDYAGAVLVSPDAEALTWLRAFAAARALKPRPRAIRSWADATSVLLAAYASIMPPGARSPAHRADSGWSQPRGSNIRS